MNKLSHSASNIYQDCPEKYRLHYQEKLRPKTQSAALFFGTAIDRAISAMFINGDYKKVFFETWSSQELNGQSIGLIFSTQIVYANSDWDEELLTNEDFESLAKFHKLPNKEEVLKEITHLYEDKEKLGFDGLKDADKRTLNHANWLCLRRKGEIMLEAVKKHILPNITEVLSLQEMVRLENSEKDAITGYIDLVCKWKDQEKPIIFDFKTATRQYEPDAVQKSPQLALYTHALSKKYNTRTAGFIVLHKTIKKNRTKVCEVCAFDGSGARHKTCSAEIQGKRCNGAWKETITPEATFQVLINEIPERVEKMVVQNMDDMNQAIKNGVFIKNFNSCIKPYGKCQFYSKCWEGKEDELVQMAEKR